jgi:hypothetical protein
VRTITVIARAIVTRPATLGAIAVFERPRTVRTRSIGPAAVVKRAIAGWPAVWTITVISRSGVTRAIIAWAAVPRSILARAAAVWVLPLVRASAPTLVRHPRTRRTFGRACARIIRSPPLHLLIEPFLPPRGVFCLPLQFEPFARIAVIAAGAPALFTALPLLPSGPARVLRRIPQRAARKPPHDGGRVLLPELLERRL